MRKKAEPTIVKKFRNKYPDSIYLKIWDKGYDKRKGEEQTPVSKDIILRWMKNYDKLRTKGLVYTKERKVVRGLKKYV